MTEQNYNERRYPIGIQTFERIIKDGYIYLDKTDLVWNMAHISPFVFLSRPRRFGKSLLSSTLHSYFAGEKELFEGLKIMELEKEWASYPVIHFDLSVAKAQPTPDALRQVLFRLLENYRKLYGEGAYETTPGGRFSGIIHRAYEQTGKQVVVIIDEYDAPLLDKLHDKTSLDEFRNVMQDFYVQLKANEALIRFCFITGITKFSQLSIFSTINNIKNISMLPQFSAICGITDTELSTNLSPDVSLMAEAYGCTKEEMHEKLKQYYDGYHFSYASEDIYNPFSLMNAFCDRQISNYWFESGTPTFLFQQMQRFHTDILGLDELEEPSSAFDRPTEAMESALPLLYQSGYLTIKGYDRESELYRLSLPNKEVRVGFIQGLLPTYVGLESNVVQKGFALKFWQALKKNDIDLALREMQAYLAGLPYIEGFKKKLENVSDREGFYEWTFYLIFNMLNIYVRTQVKCANGRADVVVFMPDTVYVIELKVDKTAQEALNQIENNGYAAQYQMDGRKVMKVGVNFSSETKTITDWIVG